MFNPYSSKWLLYMTCSDTLLSRFMPADCLWTFCMAVNVFLTFHTTTMTVDLRKLEKWYFLFCFGVPAIPALTYLGLDLTRGTQFYGNATLWCWISRDHDKLRLLTFYAPVWVMILITMLLYAITGRYIYKGQVRNSLMQNALNNEDESSWRHTRVPSDVNASLNFNVVTRTEISQVSEPAVTITSLRAPSIGGQSSTSSSAFADDGASISSSQHHHHHHQLRPRPQPLPPSPRHAKFTPIRVPGFGDGTASPPGTGTATVLIPPPPSPPGTAPCHQVTTTITTHRPPVTLPLPILSSLNPCPIAALRRPSYGDKRHISSAPSAGSGSSTTATASSKTNRGAKTYAQVAFLLYIVMLSVWVPSTANRVYGVVRPRKVNFGLNAAAAAVLPLQGFFNTLVYLFTSRHELSAAVRRLFRRGPAGAGAGAGAGAERMGGSGGSTGRKNNRPNPLDGLPRMGSESKDGWSRPESREELVNGSDDADEVNFVTDYARERLRFPWLEKRGSRSPIR
jgi:hypothetical protein